MDIVENLLDYVIDILKSKKNAHIRKKKQVAKDRDAKLRRVERSKEKKKVLAFKEKDRKLALRRKAKGPKGGEDRRKKKVGVNKIKAPKVRAKSRVRVSGIKHKKSSNVKSSENKSVGKGKIVKGKKGDKIVGEITHYFPKIGVVVVRVLSGKLSVGDRIRVKGKNADFVQGIDSMQVESIDVKSAKKGSLVGLKVKKTAKVGDKVYLSKL